MAKNQAASLRSQWLGERLRAARERAGYTLKDVGAYMEVDLTLIGKFERGTNPLRASYIRDMAALYGISDKRERDALFRLHEDAWQRDWWQGNAEDLETSFLDYTWLESRCDRIRQFSPLIIPGLLQTKAYTIAVMQHSRENLTEEEVERLVELRMRRRTVLTGPSAPGFSVILGEPAVQRATGTPAVRREQLLHLLEQPRHVEVRVLPDNADGNPDHAGPFAFFEMPDPYPEVAYTESLVDRTFFENPAKVAVFRDAYDDLLRIALPAEESRRYIESVAKELA